MKYGWNYKRHSRLEIRLTNWLHQIANKPGSVREANRTGTFKTRYVQSLLQIPQPHPSSPVYPQESRLLEIHYERRDLKNYPAYRRQG